MADWLQWGITTIIGIIALLGGRFWGKHDRKTDHDKKILDELLKIMPGDRTIQFIREKDFRGSFFLDQLDDLDDLFIQKNRKEFMFIDKELEKKRQKLVEISDEFNVFLAKSSFPKDFQGRRMNQIPQENEFKNPEKYHATIHKVHQLADEVCKIYDDLVISATKKV